MGPIIETLIGGLLTGVLYALIALGFVLIFKASGVFNFAQGAMVLFAALAVARLSEKMPLPIAIALAIVIMILVLELKAPRGADLEALRPLVPEFVSYLHQCRLRGYLLVRPSVDDVFSVSTTLRRT